MCVCERASKFCAISFNILYIHWQITCMELKIAIKRPPIPPPPVRQWADLVTPSPPEKGSIREIATGEITVSITELDGRPLIAENSRASGGPPWAPGRLIQVGSRGPPQGGRVQGQSPCWGPRGQSPRKLSSFQQIRAFKMVVRSDRNCNFSRCNFAFRALVERGAGVTRFSVVVDSMFFFFFFFYNTYLKTYVTDCERASRKFRILRWKRAIVIKLVHVTYFCRYNKSLCWFI